MVSYLKKQLSSQTVVLNMNRYYAKYIQNKTV